MSVFKVNYWRKGKEKGKRGFTGFFNSTTFEQVLFESTITDLCESNYFTHYEWFYLNEVVFVKRIKANGVRCEYKVLLYNMYDRSKLLSEYEVEIECLENDKSVDILLEEITLEEPKRIKPEKKKQLTEWFRKESTTIKCFLMLLQDTGSLKELRKSGMLSKATYYRNLSVCIEKGYIKNDKLAKRLFVSKYAN